MEISKVEWLSVATDDEKLRLSGIFDFDLVLRLAKRWCGKNNMKLGGFLGYQGKRGASWEVWPKKS